MKAYLTIALVILFAPAASSQVPTPLPAAATTAALARAQTLIDSTPTLASDFAEEVTIKSLNQKKQSSGHVFFAKPASFDLTYASGDRVTGDATSLATYSAAQGRVVIVPIASSADPVSALAFLVTSGALSTSFTFQAFNGTQMAFPGGTVLIGTPKIVNAAFDKLLLYVDDASAQIRRIMAIDGQGNRTRFDFTNPVRSGATPKPLLVPPPGTTIVNTITGTTTVVPKP